MQVQTILSNIDEGAMALPEFQRGYVWNREQVRGLMDSLYRKHPVGSLLVWVTQPGVTKARGGEDKFVGPVKLLLDGQQRITTLYGITRGKPPRFFDGDMRAFLGLHFHLEEQTFEFYAHQKMKDDPLWIDVTELMQKGVAQMVQPFVTPPHERLAPYMDRMNEIARIKDVDLHIEEVVGEDKTVDVVVDIFNRVNSGGTKLSKGDLALARICAAWPNARDALKARLNKWRRAGFNFRLELLLRIINANLTGEALFSALKDISVEDFQHGLEESECNVDRVLNMVASRLGLDHDRVLGSRYSLPILSRYLSMRGGRIPTGHERDRLLFWYVHTFLWGRFSGTTESKLNQDLERIADVTERSDAGGIDRLVEGLRQDRGDLRLTEADFRGATRGNRFYPLLYMMTRVCGARDWETGDLLSNFLLGANMKLHVHHIFPKSRLRDADYARNEINAIANFTFLTAETNERVSNRLPSEYIPDFEKKNPGFVESHWIPMDPDLWEMENYLDFLEARRELLATAANDFLDKLWNGTVPEPPGEINVAEREAPEVPGAIEDEDEQRLLRNCNRWVERKGLPTGDMEYELTDEDGDPIAILDLAWPDGLQQGLSHPVAVILNEGSDVEEACNQAGFVYFTKVRDFRRYVRTEILAGADADEDDDESSLEAEDMLLVGESI